MRPPSSQRGHDLPDEPTIREFLATTYSRPVAGVALITGNRAAAEDAGQEALARAADAGASDAKI